VFTEYRADMAPRGRVDQSRHLGLVYNIDIL